jgi:hypothetical protein
MLLLHVVASISFADMITVNGVSYLTYKEAASHRQLLASDEECDRALEGATTFQKPMHLRETITYICAFCMPSYCLLLWVKNVRHFTLYFERNQTLEHSINQTLQSIEDVPNQNGLSCRAIGLPSQLRILEHEETYNPVSEGLEAERKVHPLNQHQLMAFTEIKAATGQNNSTTKCFYINGPG